MRLHYKYEFAIQICAGNKNIGLQWKYEVATKIYRSNVNIILISNENCSLVMLICA